MLGKLRSRSPELAFLAGVFSCVAPLAANAHHSASLYDLDRDVTLDGVVTKYEWANPHVYVFVRARRGDAAAAVWEVEAAAPTIMARRGWSPDSFRVGEHVVIVANPARDEARHLALGKTVAKDDGSRLGFRGNGELFVRTPAEGAASSLAGTWLAQVDRPVTTKFVQPIGAEDAPGIGARSWPLTALGTAAVDHYDPAANPGAKCTAYTAPFSMVFPDLKTLEIGSDVIKVRSELDDAERVIHMGAVSHAGASYTNQGHSIGHWDGKALVVDTDHFTARPNGNAFKLPSSRDKHLIERFALNDDGTVLTYRFEVTDPVYFSGSVKGEIEWVYTPNRHFAAKGCDPDDARQYLKAR